MTALARTVTRPLRPDMHRVGTSTFLHNPFSGALIALELADGEHGALAGLSVSDLVRQAPADWRDAGLFLDAAPDFPDPVAARSPRNAGSVIFGLGDRRVELRSEDPVILRDVAEGLRHLIVDGASGLTDEGVDVLVAGDGFGVFRNQVAVWGRAPRDLSRFHALREVMIGLLSDANLGGTLHGAAVAKGNKAVLIVGPSGAGKTTLSLGAVSQGAMLAADDHIALDATGTALHSFATKSAVKPGAATLPHLANLLNGCRAGRDDAVLVSVPMVAVGTRLDVAGLIFPRFEAGGRNETRSLTAAETLSRLYQTGGRLIPGRPLDAFLKLATSVPCLELCFSDTAYSLDAVAEVLA